MLGGCGFHGESSCAFSWFRVSEAKLRAQAEAQAFKRGWADGLFDP